MGHGLETLQAASKLNASPDLRVSISLSLLFGYVQAITITLTHFRLARFPNSLRVRLGNLFLSLVLRFSGLS